MGENEEKAKSEAEKLFGYSDSSHGEPRHTTKNEFRYSTSELEAYAAWAAKEGLVKIYSYDQHGRRISRWVSSRFNQPGN